ncbi:hypothetical protein [Microbacterium ulmi]|uniref:Uncharacterized protein n=1 Tax=Microbacterium ulmi TaxID=179095 RepID=A0A7Y2M241_9MICO|nr:hypothetical protein [Microbacterium ulmi]NII70089.1 hypothetical protein [Microbacterium ulmi]NNH05100.1 hypothetical protein [Microbacterium ulmi]
MTRHPLPVLAGIAASVLLAVALAGCAPDSPAPGGSESSTSTGTPGPDSTATGTPTPDPTSTAAASVAVPTDCRAILSESVLSQLEGIPLNDPAWGLSGVQSDGSLKCIWAQPGADSTGLTTVISKVGRGPALDMLNALMTDQAFTCYQPDTGTRCEKQWPNPTYPVTDGRTLYWRDGILIDTTYSNLSPSGYTASIVDHVFA